MTNKDNRKKEDLEIEKMIQEAFNMHHDYIQLFNNHDEKKDKE